MGKADGKGKGKGGGVCWTWLKPGHQAKNCPEGQSKGKGRGYSQYGKSGGNWGSSIRSLCTVRTVEPTTDVEGFIEARPPKASKTMVPDPTLPRPAALDLSSRFKKLETVCGVEFGKEQEVEKQSKDKVETKENMFEKKQNAENKTKKSLKLKKACVSKPKDKRKETE